MMLLISWVVIRKMVSNMFVLQSSLQWQAWHDPLTRLYNRGALFERARVLIQRCHEQRQPFSVIQIDLDHFKSVNDRFTIRREIGCSPMPPGLLAAQYVRMTLPGA